MLSTLDTVTIAGQRHMAGKIVTFIEGQVARARRRVGHRNQSMLAELLEQLTREGMRLLPDIRTFSQRARGLVTLLAAIA